MSCIVGIAFLAVAAPQAAQPANPTATKPVQVASRDSEKIVCKRFIETGSLVKGRRECKSEADWQRERDLARQRGDGVSSCRDPSAC